MVNVLDCLSALSADLNCKCAAPGEELVLSSTQVKEACAAIDEAVDSLKRLLIISVAEGGGRSRRRHLRRDSRPRFRPQLREDKLRRIPSLSRRRTLGFLAVAAASAAHVVRAQSPALATAPITAAPPILRSIPATGERIPAIGVGSWITFDVPPGTATEVPLIPVAKTFFERGGRMIDSSPMYGYSEAVIGDLLTETATRSQLFSATKIWTPFAANGRRQFEQSLKLWGIARFDMLYIHNLLAWETHYDYVRELKAGSGRVRYIGVTTSEGNEHDEMERALTRGSFDVVQLT